MSVIQDPADSCSVEDVKAFYPDNTLITHVKGSADNHIAVLRLKCTNKEEFKEWLDTYKNISGETMRVNRGSKTKGKSVVYKAWYRCQHNTEDTHKKVKKHSLKNTGCKTNFVVTIKSSVKNRRVRSQDLLRFKYPTEIIFTRFHNHPLDSTEALKYRDVAEEIKMKIIELFKSFHSPSRALEIHKQDLLEEFEDDYHKIAADRSQCPDVQWVYKLYYNVFEKEFGDTENDIIGSIKEFVDNAKDYKAKVEEIEENIAIAIVTPFMERVHALNLSEHIVFVDSSSYMDHHNCKVYLLLSDSYVGGLPLGVIVTTSESENVLARGIELFKEIMPTNAFNERGQLGPEIFLTDNSSSLRKALSALFPASKLLICAFPILQAVWRWINNKTNNIRTDHKQELLIMFKQILTVNNIEEYQSAISEFQNCATVNLYPHYIKYIDTLLQKSGSWNYARRDPSTDNIHNTFESAINVLKDKVLHRCRTFNISQLLHFLSVTLPDVYTSKMLDTLMGRYSSYTHLKYLPNKKKLEDLVVVSQNNGLYEFSNSTSDTKYQANLEIGTCTCPVGCTGAPCKHMRLSSILTKTDDINTVPITEEEKMMYQWIATGNVDNPSEWDDSLEVASTLKIINAPLTEECPAPSPAASTSDSLDNEEDTNEQDLEDVKAKLKQIYEILVEKTEQDKQNFVSAVNKMHKTTLELKNYDSALCSAMHNFGENI